MIKVSAKFELQGGTMYSKKEAKDRNLYKANSMTVGTGKDQERITYMTRKTIPCYQVINISDVAYNSWIKRELTRGLEGNWKSAGKQALVKLHLEEIAKSLNAKLVDFTILPD